MFSFKNTIRKMLHNSLERKEEYNKAEIVNSGNDFEREQKHVAVVIYIESN